SGGEEALELFVEAEQLRIFDAVDVELTVQVVELVLKHRCKEAAQLELVGLPVEARIAHPYPLRPLHEAAKAGDRQATFPVSRRGGIEDLDARVDENRQRHCRNFAVAAQAAGNLDDR